MLKKEVSKIDATPSKSIYRSIIADYDINRSICELIDNVIDIWVKNNKTIELNLKIYLDEQQQTIIIQDNIGGLKYEDLKFIVSPGSTTNNLAEETIGLFGVGSKRAVVALSQKISIKSRYKNEKTFEIEYDDEWLKDLDWSLPVYSVNDIEPETTIIELVKLRYSINHKTITDLQNHLGMVYAKFCSYSNFNIYVNNEKVLPILFENWSFPPKYLPQKNTVVLNTTFDENANIEIISGLTNVSSPSGEYGVYFYCNERLIAKSLKDSSVGFEKGIVGLPHPNKSLARVFVMIKGSAILMPWNSSKSGIYANSEVFLKIRPTLIEIVKNITRISSSLEGKWDSEVFKYTKGEIVERKYKRIDEFKTKNLPVIPKSKFTYSDIVQKVNKNLGNEKPWTRGLYESIIVIDYLFGKNYSEKNRMVLILLDSTLEIAFKEFLVNESGKYYTNDQLLRLFSKRHLVIDEIKSYKSIFPDNSKWEKIWKKVNYYYGLRCKLVHERVSIGIIDDDIENYRDIIENILNKLFGLNFIEDV